MGLGTLEVLPSLKVTRSSMPEDTRVMILAYEH